MTNVNNPLFEAFRADHAVFGAGLHVIRTSLVAGDVEAAKAAADKLHREAGAHIAFEEIDFYPALEPFLSEQEITNMYEEHRAGLELVNGVRSAPASAPSADTLPELIQRIDAFEAHVSECGELFGVMGALSAEEQADLLEKLKAWRAKAPTWTEAQTLSAKSRT